MLKQSTAARAGAAAELAFVLLQQCIFGQLQ
jgi:hypothetical protein